MRERYSSPPSRGGVQRDLNEPLRPPYDGALRFETSKHFRNGGIDKTMYLRATFYY
jgi:hypothetical protein